MKRMLLTAMLCATLVFVGGCGAKEEKTEEVQHEEVIEVVNVNDLKTSLVGQKYQMEKDNAFIVKKSKMLTIESISKDGNMYSNAFVEVDGEKCSVEIWVDKSIDKTYLFINAGEDSSYLVANATEEMDYLFDDLLTELTVDEVKEVATENGGYVVDCVTSMEEEGYEDGFETKITLDVDKNLNSLSIQMDEESTFVYEKNEGKEIPAIPDYEWEETTEEDLSTAYSFGVLGLYMVEEWDEEWNEDWEGDESSSVSYDEGDYIIKVENANTVGMAYTKAYLSSQNVGYSASAFGNDIELTIYSGNEPLTEEFAREIEGYLKKDCTEELIALVDGSTIKGGTIEDLTEAFDKNEGIAIVYSKDGSTYYNFCGKLDKSSKNESDVYAITKSDLSSAILTGETVDISYEDIDYDSEESIPYFDEFDIEVKEDASGYIIIATYK
jgi:hypothetical protein